MHAVDEGDRDLLHPQGAAPGDDLQPYLEAGGLRIDRQQPLPAHREEAGHGIGEVGQRPGERGTQPRQYQAPKRPPRYRATRHEAAAHHHVARSVEHRLDEGAKAIGRMAEVGIHDDHDIGTGKGRRLEHIAGETALSLAGDEAHIGHRLPGLRLPDGAVRGTAVGDQDLELEAVAALPKDPRKQMIDILGLIQRRHDDRHEHRTRQAARLGRPIQRMLDRFCPR